MKREWVSNISDKRLERKLKRLMKRLAKVANGKHISIFVMENHVDATVYGKEEMESIWTAR